ncbi:unnamed protein product [Chilo suppressalis]|uniref:RNase NYN domain-containing protein n=2 Tax=Chilo suppressalis TaxID=168631 RepID=A0ABN8L506_CHISP|nr:unnamed protein product [Chilo suppressalis]
MGKPSSTRLSKQQSQDSLSSSITKSSKSKKDKKMGRKHKKRSKHNKIHKANEKLREHKSKQNKIEKLKKVFNDLRNQSNQNIDSPCDNTVIVLDDTIINENLSKKRKLSELNILESDNKCIKLTNDIPVVIPDNDVLIVSTTPRKNLNTAPKDCSTPLAKSTESIPQNNNTVEAENFNRDVDNLTKEINRDSYLTIDLTTESNITKTDCNTVIDLDNTNDNHECTFVSASNSSLSISGESNVTILQNPKRKMAGGQRMSSFVNHISKLNASDKGKLLELITENIFNGCKVPRKIKKNISMLKGQTNRATETVEDTYIKEVILGERQSRNSIGSNIYNPEKDERKKSGLRMIVVDGSNVAMEHGKGRVFSVKGLKICIDYFLRRGHVVKAFVPRFRCKFGKSTEPRLLDELERRGLVVYTPSREIQGRMVTSYDDRYIVQCAAEFDGVIVSGDNYRDLHRENPRWRFVIENRVLPFTWVNDMIMFPRDPLGRNGPSLETLLKHPPDTKNPKRAI